MHLENQTILLTSNEPWGDIWYSKQNYAYELSKKNKVLFLNPPKNWKLQNLIYNPITTVNYSENLSIITYQNYLPLITNTFNRLNNLLVSKHLKKYLQKNKYHEYILWAFDPIRLYNHKQIGADFGIYHCVDFFYFKFLGEIELCKNSNIIFAVSQRLLNEYSSFNTPKYIVPHSISSEEFNIDTFQLNKLDITLTDYALYIGVIDERIDFELLEKVIIKFPSIPFVFVGPISSIISHAAKRIFEQKTYKNVYAIGPRHFKTLKNYVKKSRFCISLLKMSYHANTISHHKTLVYLAQGKPVFSPVFSEYKDLGNLMYMNNTHDGIIALLDMFIQYGEKKHVAEERIAYARKYAFENTLKDASAIIKKHTEKNIK